MKRKGNQYWGKPNNALCGVLVPEFERVTTHLKLNDEQSMLRSAELRQWIFKHHNQRYVPEWLLKRLGIHVVMQDWGISD
jgi:hypothetical protein